MTLEEVKDALRVSGNQDDDLLERLLASAVSECLRFTGLEELDSNSEEDLWQGVMVIIQGDYDADARDRNRYRRAAEVLWMPYRIGLGV